MKNLWSKDEPEPTIPEELKGLTPEQIVEKMKAGDEAKRLLDEREAQLATVAVEQNKLKEQIQALELKSVKQVPESTPEDEKPDDFWDNPEGSIRKSIEPLAKATLVNQIMLARMSAIDMLKSSAPTERNNGEIPRFVLWTKYLSEIDANSQQMAPIQLTSPQTWLNLLSHTIGVHFNEITKDPSKFALDSGSSDTASLERGSIQRKKSDTLTDVEKNIAKKLGVPEEKYLESRNRMVTSQLGG